MKDIVRDMIIRYGIDIIQTDEFYSSFSQKHHIRTTVGEHTLGVAAEGVKFCLRHGIHDGKTLRNVVRSCLSHDLGILGRQDKFKNNYECLKKHPKHSSEKYRQLFGEDNDRVNDAILYHMFPLRLHAPKYKEGWILVLADKKASIKEHIGKTDVTQEDIKIFKELSGKEDQQ